MQFLYDGDSGSGKDYNYITEYIELDTARSSKNAPAISNTNYQFQALFNTNPSGLMTDPHWVFYTNKALIDDQRVAAATGWTQFFYHRYEFVNPAIQNLVVNNQLPNTMPDGTPTPADTLYVSDATSRTMIGESYYFGKLENASGVPPAGKTTGYYINFYIEPGQVAIAPNPWKALGPKPGLVDRNIKDLKFMYYAD